MSYDSPDVEREFPGLYKDEGSSQGDGSDFSEEDHELNRLRKRELGKKKDKKDKKDKGYKMFEEEDSEEELMVPEEREVRSPGAKLKKHSKPSFRFGKKEVKLKPKEKDKDEREKKEREREKELKREEKEKKREEKKKEKLKKKTKQTEIVEPVDDSLPVFGVPLDVAVERSKGHDGVELPIVFRECIDYVEEHGLTCEGIYRISGVKSKVQSLKDCYNRGQPGYLCEHEPNVVGSLLKTFLRELTEPVLTMNLMQKFEEASTIKNPPRRVDQLKRLIAELPTPNRLLLSWMIIHMSHVIAKEKINRMSLQNVSIVLSPTMQISHRVLNVLFIHCRPLFGHVTIKKYVPPLRPASSKWSLEVPDDPVLIEEEIKKQESLLNQLHEDVNCGKSTVEKEEQLWEVQRVVTQLKRKLKVVRKQMEIKEQERVREIELRKQQEAHRIESEKKMNSEMQKLFESAKMQFMPPPEDEEEGGETCEVAEEKTVPETAQDEEVKEEQTTTEDAGKEGSETEAEVKVEESENDEETEKVESGVDEPEEEYTSGTTSEAENEESDHEDEIALLQEHAILLLEEEELLATRSEIMKKIESEQLEIERLEQEIEEIEELRSIRSRNIDSDATSSTDSSSESEEDEDELIEILQNLMSENSRLERENASLCEKTHQESQICLEVKVQIRVLQQQQQQVDLMSSQQTIESLMSSGDTGLLDRDNI